MILLPHQYERVWYSTELSTDPVHWREPRVLAFAPFKSPHEADLACLRKFPELFGILLNAGGTTDISSVFEHSEIRFLGLSAYAGPIDVRRFPALEYLFLDYVKGQSLAGHESVRCLQVVDYPHHDLRPLAAWPRLEWLRLGARLRRMDGIEQLSSLRGIEIQGGSKVEDLSQLSARPGLEEFRADPCKHVRDWTCLADCRKLTSLALIGCGRIPSIGFMREMPQLETVLLVGTTVDDCDLSPLLGRKLVAITERRRYTHTQAQLDAAARKS